MFNGRVVVVTGGSNGIGLATANRFSEMGAIVYNLDKEVPESNPNQVFMKCDVRNPSEVRDAVKQIHEKEKHPPCEWCFTEQDLTFHVGHLFPEGLHFLLKVSRATCEIIE